LNDLTSFLQNNQYLLRQIRQQLLVLPEQSRDIYSAPIPIIGGASIGAHLRHILDFYTAFYFGAKKTHIDYDDRKRELLVEQQFESGLTLLSTVIEQLESMSGEVNRSVTINAAIEVSSDQAFGQSNMIRELQSLHSHTTHHMAIIAIVLKLNEIAVDDDFGKAPSTVQYERQLKTVRTGTMNKISSLKSC
jgi:hypothetical protein